MNTPITRYTIEKAMSYEQYRSLIDELLEKGQTTGTNQAREMIEYTRLNVQRMNRLDKTVEILPELGEILSGLKRDLVWVVLTEAWCGDAAQNVPVIARIARESSRIRCLFLLRDDHPKIMDAYLTQGSRSIPKLICLDAENLDELCTWGPRPAEAQKMAMAFKNTPGKSKEEFMAGLHLWYGRDGGQTLQREFVDWLRKCSA